MNTAASPFPRLHLPECKLAKFRTVLKMFGRTFKKAAFQMQIMLRSLKLNLILNKDIRKWRQKCTELLDLLHITYGFLCIKTTKQYSSLLLDSTIPVCSLAEFPASVTTVGWSLLSMYTGQS